jgi:hypothetical protein
MLTRIGLVVCLLLPYALTDCAEPDPAVEPAQKSDDEAKADPFPRPAVNLIKNPGFESGSIIRPIADWTMETDCTGGRYKSKAVYSATSDGPAEGKRCVQLFNLVRDPSSKADKFSVVYLRSALIEIDKSKSYLAGGKLKLSRPTEGMKAFALVEVVDDFGKPMGSSSFWIRSEAKDGWMYGQKVFDNWETFTARMKFRWSRVRVCVAVFIEKDQGPDVKLCADDFFFSPIEGNMIETKK